MKRTALFLILSFSIVNAYAECVGVTADCAVKQAATKYEDNDYEQIPFPLKDYPYFQQFVNGLIMGAVAGTGVEYARNNLLPDMTEYKLYDTYGICREQLTGVMKMLVASVGASAIGTALIDEDTKKLVVKIVGILTGLCGSSYMLHFVKSKNNATVAPVIVAS